MTNVGLLRHSPRIAHDSAVNHEKPVYSGGKARGGLPFWADAIAVGMSPVWSITELQSALIQQSATTADAKSTGIVKFEEGRHGVKNADVRISERGNKYSGTVGGYCRETGRQRQGVKKEMVNQWGTKTAE